MLRAFLDEVCYLRHACWGRKVHQRVLDSSPTFFWSLLTSQLCGSRWWMVRYASPLHPNQWLPGLIPRSSRCIRVWLAETLSSTSSASASSKVSEAALDPALREFRTLRGSDTDPGNLSLRCRRCIYRCVRMCARARMFYIYIRVALCPSNGTLSG